MKVISEVKKTQSGSYQGVVSFVSNPALSECIISSFKYLYKPTMENANWGLRPSEIDGYIEAHCEFATHGQATSWNNTISSLIIETKNKNL